MEDIIRISVLELWTHIGVPEEERSVPQRILISVELALSTKSAAKRDSVSIDYATVAEDLRNLAREERRTIERLAEDAAAVILKKYRPKSVSVTVHKFALPGAKEVTLTITRP